MLLNIRLVIYGVIITLFLAVGAKSGSGFAVSRLVTDSVKSRLGSTPSPSEVAPKITRTLVRPSASKTGKIHYVLLTLSSFFVIQWYHGC